MIWLQCYRSFSKPLTMKTLLLLLMLLVCVNAKAQPSKNIFIITTDGFRWQEVFSGADSLLVNDTTFVKDTELIRQLYWHSNVDERRKKLMPFFWNTIAEKGQLYGNRVLGNKVNVKNLYKISYPGYNEIFTGYADPFRMKNHPTVNKNVNILEYLNALPEFSGQVVAFSSWNVFPYIFNVQRSGILQESGYQVGLTDSNGMVRKVQDQVEHKTDTRHDLLTFFSAKEYIQKHHPRMVSISLGETDEFAHADRYDFYLQQANKFDNMLAELWYYVQTDPFYKNNTTFIITTDHGRGTKPGNWHRHNISTKGSGDIWLALLGEGIEPVGVMATHETVYQNQIAATVANLAGENFKPNRKVGKKINLNSLSGGNVFAEKPIQESK